jgi:hypothetical protein
MGSTRFVLDEYHAGEEHRAPSPGTKKTTNAFTKTTVRDKQVHVRDNERPWSKLKSATASGDIKTIASLRTKVV